MQPSDAHLRPRTASEVAASVEKAMPAEGGVMIAIGQYAPDPSRAQRVIVLALDGDGVRDVADAWMAVGDEEWLRVHLSAWAPRLAATDAMYATPWKYAWTTDDGPFQLWDASGALLVQEGARFMLRSAATLEDVDGVHGFLAADWVERGVRLVLAGGGTIDLATTQEVSAAIDPTYDGIDLLVDACWITELTGRLARALAVPATFDEALR